MKPTTEMRPSIASFLFADVKGYSKLEEFQVKCFYQEILPKLKLKVDEYKEHITDINTWGDGLMIVSEDPYNLAHLALDIRDFYNNYNWKSHGMPELVVRISLHHGVIYKGLDPFRDREGVIGTEVTLGARLEPVTEPGQVWVTEEFRVLIKEARDHSIQFDDLDMRELAKDFDTIHVYKLRRATEAAESPK
jgi:class 3 adenylate cyclase